jgi:DNA-binding Xre family transcriptional regulator
VHLVAQEGEKMSSQIDFVQLAALVRAKRGQRGLREIAEEIGDISPSTLSRIEGNKANDIALSTFLQICDWLGISSSDLILQAASDIQSKMSAADSHSIVLQLRAAKDIDPKTARMLAEMVKAAVKESKRPKNNEDEVGG